MYCTCGHVLQYSRIEPIHHTAVRNSSARSASRSETCETCHRGRPSLTWFSSDRKRQASRPRPSDYNFIPSAPRELLPYVRLPCCQPACQCLVQHHSTESVAVRVYLDNFCLSEDELASKGGDGVMSARASVPAFLSFHASRLQSSDLQHLGSDGLLLNIRIQRRHYCVYSTYYIVPRSRYMYLQTMPGYSNVILLPEAGRDIGTD